MMVSKKDVDRIVQALGPVLESATRRVVREELRAALGRTLVMEKGPRQPGDPEKATVQEEWDVITALLVYLPRIEGALRGMQADVDRTVNSVDANNVALDFMANILVGLENPIMALGKVGDMVAKRLGNQTEGLIE